MAHAVSQNRHNCQHRGAPGRHGAGSYAGFATQRAPFTAIIPQNERCRSWLCRPLHSVIAHCTCGRVGLLLTQLGGVLLLAPEPGYNLCESRDTLRAIIYHDEITIVGVRVVRLVLPKHMGIQRVGIAFRPPALGAVQIIKVPVGLFLRGQTRYLGIDVPEEWTTVEPVLQAGVARSVGPIGKVWWPSAGRARTGRGPPPLPGRPRPRVAPPALTPEVPGS